MSRMWPSGFHYERFICCGDFPPLFAFAGSFSPWFSTALGNIALQLSIQEVSDFQYKRALAKFRRAQALDSFIPLQWTCLQKKSYQQNGTLAVVDLSWISFGDSSPFFGSIFLITYMFLFRIFVDSLDYHLLSVSRSCFGQPMPWSHISLLKSSSEVCIVIYRKWDPRIQNPGTFSAKIRKF